MKILKSWLNDWIDIENIDSNEISDALESLGFEIESRIEKIPNYKNIVVGKVLDIYEHPNADKVRVTKVDVGSKVYEIVCGAWNFDINAIVPVALPNSEIKDGFKIEKRDIRGVESNGMICSASELDLWDDHAGILKLSENTKVGSDFAKIYSSVDTIWEIGVTPNRGDCMSHLGIARELSRYFETPIKSNEIKLDPNIENVIKVNSGKTKFCNSYLSIEIENFDITDSDIKVRYRLSSVGVRVINNVVDYTNYVLHDIGQPLHAFDRDKLFGTVSVRKAKDNETLKTLDEQTRKLSNEDLIITDNDTPIALAGVMGGYNSEVTESTKNLLIESAYFDKVSIMKTSRRLNLISDASIRFERGIDYELQNKGLERFISVFKNDQNIYYSKISSSKKDSISYEEVTFDKNDIFKILGVEMSDEFIKSTLSQLQIKSKVTSSKITFKSPSWRYDLERPIDLIEELAKHYGFNNFQSTLPIGNNLNNKGEYWYKRKYISELLSSNNFYEIQTLSFADSESNKIFSPEKNPVTVINPIDQTQENLRTNLLFSLINTYKYNYENNSVSHKYYEINNIYDDGKHKLYKNIPNQEYSLGLLIPEYESNTDSRGELIHNDIHTLTNFIKLLFPQVQFEQISRPGFHKNYSYILKLNNQIIGFMGKLSYKAQSSFNLDTPLYIMQINTENFNLNEIEVIKYQPLSSFPFIKFDLSFSVNNEFRASELVEYIETLLPNNENKISIFDNFRNEKSRNLGIRIVTRNYNKTYTDTESGDILDMIVENVQSKYSIKLNKSGNDAT
jgi:phenylalanyl-tRNA synthetase beta chain